MIIEPVDDPRVSELISFSDACTQTGLSYFQLRYAMDTGKIGAVRLAQSGPHLLVRASLEDFVKVREQKRKRASLKDTPSTKDQSTGRRARREVS